MACRSDGSGREFVQDQALWEVAGFRMQVSRATRNVRPGPSQRACAALALDKCDRFLLSDRLATVLAMRPRKCRGKLEPDDPPADYGSRVHGISVPERMVPDSPKVQEVPGPTRAQVRECNG
jgi:hypothetical protein